MKISKKITIAIDGHSSCGKSTLAKDLAKKLEYTFVDSGAMYRAVTLYCLRNGIIDEYNSLNVSGLLEALNEINVSFNYNRTSGRSDTYLNGERVEDDIREMRVSESVSAVSKLEEVRNVLVQFQQQLGKNKGVVMDGRDIGTVVFPDAKLKIFMTADIDIRAQRRYEELLSKGQSISIKAVKENLISRDRQDTSRKHNPLVKADDAIVLDNSFLTKQQQLEQVKAWVHDRLHKTE